MHRIRKATKTIVISWLKENKNENNGFYTRFWFDEEHNIYLQKGRSRVKLYSTEYAKKVARKSIKRTRPRNRIKKGYHSEEERVVVSNETSEIDDSEYDIVAKKNNSISDESESKSSILNKNSIHDKDEDFESNELSHSEESSDEDDESESSESVVKNTRKPQPKSKGRTVNKPSAKKSVASTRRNKTYEEDKHVKTTKPKVVPKMRRGFDEIHYMQTKGAGYATERDDLKYINESEDESVEESKVSSRDIKEKQPLSSKSESDSESDEIIEEKLDLLKKGIKDNIKDTWVIEPNKSFSDSEEESKHKDYDFSEDLSVMGGSKRAGYVKRIEIKQRGNFEPITDMERTNYQNQTEKFDSNYDLLLNRLQLNFLPEALPCKRKK